MTEKTRCGGTMTESAFLSWIRSALRSKSLSWKPRSEALRLARRAYKGLNKRQLWEYKCAMCSAWWAAKEVVVDHFPVACGSLTSIEDIGPFANNLYCEVDNLRILCKVCHDAHTLAERLGISLEEAKIRKAALEKIKSTPPKKLLAYLAQNGYSGLEVSNKGKREKAILTILKGGKNA